MKFDTKTVLIGLLILAVLYLLMCRGKSVIEKPVTVPVQVIKDSIIKDTAETKRITDSLSGIISTLDNSLNRHENALKTERDKTAGLQKDNEFLLSQLNSDELPNRLREQAEKLKANQQKKDSLCTAIGKNLRAQLANTNKQLYESQKLGKKLNSLLDTCLKSQQSLDKYADQMKPRNKVALGIVGNVYPILGYGIGIDYLTKTGYIFGVSAMQMDKQTYFGISLKKVISFK